MLRTWAQAMRTYFMLPPWRSLLVRRGAVHLRCIFDNRLLLQHACSCKDFSADAPGTAPRTTFQFEALLLLVSNVSRGDCLAEAAEAKAAEEFRERSGAVAEASQEGAVEGQAEAKVGRLQDDTANEIDEEEEQEGEDDNKMDELLTEEAAYPTESQVRDAFLKAYSTLLASGTASPDACMFRVPLKCIMKRPLLDAVSMQGVSGASKRSAADAAAQAAVDDMLAEQEAGEDADGDADAAEEQEDDLDESGDAATA